MTELVNERSERLLYQVKHEKRNFHLYKQPCTILFVVLTNDGSHGFQRLRPLALSF